MSESSDASVDPEDTIKILVATDIHLGYNYSKKRGAHSDDSFVTFEEILKYGRDNEVDLVLLGGDLFHDTKPSQVTLLKCIELLRKYCLGTRECQLEFLSDSELVFRHCTQKHVNYEDPNLNISMPIFTIHGNHDDPSFGTVGSIDVLSATGFVNYFGKWTDLSRIVVPPIILKKRNTNVALYGLSYINDQRLSRLYRDEKVELLRPKDMDTFNIFVLHQNRAKHCDYAYVPENRLHKFLDLIIWGHEHECRISPEFNAEGEYYILQPGSSIATSLCEAESKPKHVGILKINKSNFKLQPLKLKSVRPYIFENMILRDHDIKIGDCVSLADSVSQYVDQYIENELMPRVVKQLTGYPNQPIQPLIRLRIFFEDEDEQFDTLSLAQKYCDEVANPMEMILFRKTSTRIRRALNEGIDDVDDIAELFQGDADNDWISTVPGGIKKYFDKEENKDKLTVLTVKVLNEALNRFVDLGDTDAFKNAIKSEMKKNIAHVKAQNIDNAKDIHAEIKKFRDGRLAESREEDQEQQRDNAAGSSVNQSSPKRVEQSRFNVLIDSSDDSSEDLSSSTASSRGRGRGRGTGTRARGRARGTSTGDRGTKRGRGRAKKCNDQDIEQVLQRCRNIRTRPATAEELCIDIDSD